MAIIKFNDCLMGWSGRHESGSVLDALVIDFDESEGLTADSSAPSPPCASSFFYRSRRLILKIRYLAESGGIDSAIGLLGLHGAVVLGDRRLFFCPVEYTRKQ